MSPADTMEVDRESSFRIEKLNGSNWTTWKSDIKAVLIDKDLWDVVDPKAAEAEIRADPSSTRKLMRAGAIIHLSLDKTQKLLIINAANGREAFKLLCDTYDTQDAASKLAKQTLFNSLKQVPSESVVIWISRVTAEATEAKNIGCKIDDSDIVSVMLNGLNARNQHTKNNLLTGAAHAGSELNLEGVKRALIASEISDQVSNGTTPSAFFSRRAQHGGVGFTNTRGSANSGTRRKGKCNWCQNDGHWEKECRKKKAGIPRRETRDTQSNQATAKAAEISFWGATATANAKEVPVKGFKATTKTYENMWFLDSGCSHHLIADSRYFVNQSTVTDKVVDEDR